MTGKEMEQHRTTAVGAANEFADFPDTMSGRDQLGMTIPRYQFNGEDGTYSFNLVPDDVKEELTVVILGGKASRVYFAGKYDPDHKEPPACKSADGVTPIEGTGPDNVLKCADCALSKWVGDEAPDCWQCYDLLCVETETGAPFIITFKRTGLKPLRAYEASLRIKGRSVFSILTTMSSDTELYGKKEYCVPKFTVKEKLSPKDALPYFELFERLQGQFNTQAPDFDETPTEASSADPFDFNESVQKHFPNATIVGDEEEATQ